VRMREREERRWHPGLKTLFKPNAADAVYRNKIRREKRLFTA